MSWDDEAAEWDDDPAVRAYSRGAFRSLQEVLTAHAVSLEGARVLDFGCGTGLLTEQLAAGGAQVVGLDLSPAMVAVLEQKALPDVSTLAGPLEEHLPALARQPLTLVVASSVCSFLPDYPGTVAALAELLAPGGLFVQWDWEEDPEAAKPNGLTREAIGDALTAAGLADVCVDIGFEQPFSGFVMSPLRGVGRAPR